MNEMVADIEKFTFMGFIFNLHQEVKPLHNWMEQIWGCSQKNLILFVHLEKSTCCICISNQTVVHIILNFFILSFLFDFTRQKIPNVMSKTLVVTSIIYSIILIKVYAKGSMCQSCSFRENFLNGRCLITSKVVKCLFLYFF